MATKPKAKSKSPVKPRKPVPARKPAPARAKSAARAAAKPAPKKPAARPAPKAKKPAPATVVVKPAKPPHESPKAKPHEPAVASVKPAEGPRPKAAATSGSKHGSGRKPSRRSGSGLRRGSDGELFKPGEVLLPGGPQTGEEITYLFRGCVAAERPSLDSGIDEVLVRLPTGDAATRDPETVRAELRRFLDAASQRFDSGRIEAALPSRANVSRRGFADVVDRARGRRREIGAFLRGLDLGRTESSHMDSHGEASLQLLMEWAARLENLADADEREQADYAQIHRGLDQLETTTETLIIDVEQTLRRLRDRTRAS